MRWCSAVGWQSVSCHRLFTNSCLLTRSVDTDNRNIHLQWRLCQTDNSKSNIYSPSSSFSLQLLRERSGSFIADDATTFTSKSPTVFSVWLKLAKQLKTSTELRGTAGSGGNSLWLHHHEQLNEIIQSTLSFLAVSPISSLSFALF